MIKIVLIDDDNAIYDILSSSLDKNEFEISLAITGKGGLDMVKVVRPDIVILDEILPDSLGDDLLTTIRSNPETSNIPVVIYTAYPSAEGKEEAIKYKKTHFIPKTDMSPDVLAKKIKSFIE